MKREEFFGLSYNKIKAAHEGLVLRCGISAVEEASNSQWYNKREGS